MPASTAFWLSLLSASALGASAGTLAVTSAGAVEFPDGRVAFEKSPRLLGARATFDGVNIRHVEYYFTISLPADIGEPLQAVVIAQQPNTETIEFLLEETVAFLGTSPRKGEPIAVAAATQTAEGSPIAIELAEPVTPGATVTVGVVARRNPRFGGIYLFRVEALPPGEKPLALALGLGRLTFRDSSFSDFGRSRRY